MTKFKPIKDLNIGEVAFRCNSYVATGKMDLVPAYYTKLDRTTWLLVIKDKLLLCNNHDIYVALADGEVIT
jgi:hypothetical protein